jgi:hypothetical protein
VGLSGTLLHGPPGTLDLGGLPHPLLSEHRQHDDPPARCNPVGNPYRFSVEVETQLAQLATSRRSLPRQS